MKKVRLITPMLALMILVLITLGSEVYSGSAAEKIVEGYAGSSVAKASNDTPATSVTMVFVNPGDARQTARAAEELAALLEQETGFTVRAIVPACLGAAVDWLATGQADYGWLPATTYVFAHDRAGAEAILVAMRYGYPYYRGQFLVRNDSGIDSLADLAGQNFAFPSDQSASGFLYPILHIFKTQGVTYDEFFDQVVFTGSHPGALEAVYYADFEGTPIQGGAMFEDVRVTSTIDDIFAKTKVIDYTDYIPNDNIAVRPGVPATITQQIIAGLQESIKRPEWSDIMSRLYAWQDAAPTDDSAYDPIRDAVQYFGLELEECARTSILTPAAGGELAHAGSGGLTTKIQVPPGAVSDTVQLSFTPLEVLTHIPPGLNEIDHAFDLTGVISGTTQTVASLVTPYTMTVSYLPGQLQGMDENGLALYRWDGTAWTREASSQVDATYNRVTATPNHLSLFAVMGSHRSYTPMIVKP